jgi:hypothetical protein
MCKEMGNKQARPESENLKGVFGKELQVIDGLLGMVLNDEGTDFRNTQYQTKSKKICDRYFMVLESDLTRHIKLELQDLKDNIYLIPQDSTELRLRDNKRFTKAEICKEITSHYTRIFNVIRVIKEVLDVENGGNFSLAGIVQQNIDMTNDVIEVRFCEAEQMSVNPQELINQLNKESKRQKRARIDFFDLKGMRVFRDSLLSDEEATRFRHHLSALLQRSSATSLRKTLCKHVLLDKPSMEAIYGETPDCNNIDHLDLKQTNTSFKLIVAPNNPILSPMMCRSQRRYIVNVAKQTPEQQQLVRLYKNFRQHYQKNVEKLVALLNKMLTFDQTQRTATLQFLDSKQVAEYEKECKVVIIAFYLQSIIDYQRMLDLAKTMDVTKINDSRL